MGCMVGGVLIASIAINAACAARARYAVAVEH